MKPKPAIELTLDVVVVILLLLAMILLAAAIGPFYDTKPVYQGF